MVIGCNHKEFWAFYLNVGIIEWNGTWNRLMPCFPKWVWMEFFGSDINLHALGTCFYPKLLISLSSGRFCMHFFQSVLVLFQHYILLEWFLLALLYFWVFIWHSVIFLIILLCPIILFFFFTLLFRINLFQYVVVQF